MDSNSSDSAFSESFSRQPHEERRPESELHLLRDLDESTRYQPSAPFVWQRGVQLLLLDEEPKGWVLAELEFQPDVCRYAEVRRAVYDWEREAVGSVMSRALASGEYALVDAANALNSWLINNYGHSIHEAPQRARHRFSMHMS